MSDHHIGSMYNQFIVPPNAESSPNIDCNLSFESGYTSADSFALNSSISSEEASPSSFLHNIRRNIGQTQDVNNASMLGGYQRFIEVGPGQIDTSGSSDYMAGRAINFMQNGELNFSENSLQNPESVHDINSAKTEDWDSQLFNSFQDNLFSLPDLELSGVSLEDYIPNSPVSSRNRAESTFQMQQTGMTHVKDVTSLIDESNKTQFFPLEDKTNIYQQMRRHKKRRQRNASTSTPKMRGYDANSGYYTPGSIPFSNPMWNDPPPNVNVTSKENREGPYQTKQKLTAARALFRQTLDRAVEHVKLTRNCGLHSKNK